MATGYTRIHAADIVTGATILASHFNDEYDAIKNTFDATTGHTHDGTTGGGAPIPLTTAVSGQLPVANGGNGASTADAARINLGIPVANSLINGGFEVWQRGAGGSASIAVAASTTAYTADRWYITTPANSAHTISQQAGLTNGSRYSGRFQRKSGQTGIGAIVAGQPYTTDMIVPLRGSKITISGYLASGADWSPTSGNLTISFYCGTSTEAKRGAGFSSETTVVSTTIALTAGSSATAFTATSSAVLPTSATQGELQITWTPVSTASTNDWFTIDDVKVEANIGTTTFDRPKFRDELRSCRPFYTKTFLYNVAPAQNAGISGNFAVRFPTGASGQWAFLWEYPEEMRSATPTITTFNPSAASADWRDTSAAADRTASTTENSSRCVVIQLASGVAGSFNIIHATADAEL